MDKLRRSLRRVFIPGQNVCCRFPIQYQLKYCFYWDTLHYLLIWQWITNISAVSSFNIRFPVSNIALYILDILLSSHCRRLTQLTDDSLSFSVGLFLTSECSDGNLIQKQKCSRQLFERWIHSQLWKPQCHDVLTGWPDYEECCPGQNSCHPGWAHLAPSRCQD